MAEMFPNSSERETQLQEAEKAGCLSHRINRENLSTSNV